VDGFLVFLETDQSCDMFLAVSDLFDTYPSRKRPAIESKPQLRKLVTEPRRGESRQEPSLIFSLRNDDADRISARNHGQGPLQQGMTEDHRALFVCVKKNKHSVRLPKERNLDVMLDSKFVLLVMSDRQSALPRGTNGTGHVNFDVMVAARRQPPLQEDRDGVHFSVAFHDRHDSVPGHGVIRP